MFNEYMWQTYLNAGGEAVVEMFERNLSIEYTEEYAERIKELRAAYCPEGVILNDSYEQLMELFDRLGEEVSYVEGDIAEIKLFLDDLANAINEENDSDQNLFIEFSEALDYYSTFAALTVPNIFVPYHFKYNFNILKMIAREFDINLPPIPVKKDYKGRFYYYGEICATLYDFRQEHNMTPYELCAFLYDFAPKYIGGIDSYIVKDVPAPQSAYFIGGSKDDAFLSEKKDVITCWQCNPDTRVGDMIVMYLRTPISAVDSVWQSVSIGFNDPFFYYYRCAYISKPVGISRIPQKQLQQDEIFKEMPIVKKNMQGLNGVELKPSQYNHLLDLAGSDLPRLEFAQIGSDEDFAIEKDVENKLVKPLLEKLGYSEDEYEQQMHLEVGNHNFTLIPDFVILPTKERGRESAYFLIEAKLSIPTLSALEEVNVQAHSYARQLNAKYSVIAAKEKVWVTSSIDDYQNVIFSATWSELNNADKFSELNKLLGYDKR